MKDLFYEQALNYLVFPTYIEALLTILLGRKATFFVTSKSKKESQNSSLFIQRLTLLCCLGILFVGIVNYLAAPAYSRLLNLFWLVYSMLLLAAGVCLASRAQQQTIKSTNQLIPAPIIH